jgi:predicted transcriptional regulator
MEATEKEIFEKAEKVTELLQHAIKTFENDRARAIENYEMLKSQMDRITGELDLHMSDEAKLEAQVNVALKLVMQSSDRLDKVIKITSDIMINQLNNLTKEKIAKTFAQREIGAPVDIEKFKRRRAISEMTGEDEDHE